MEQIMVLLDQLGADRDASLVELVSGERARLLRVIEERRRRERTGKS
jgi:hypothetical protein